MVDIAIAANRDNTTISNTATTMHIATTTYISATNTNTNIIRTRTMLMIIAQTPHTAIASTNLDILL